MDATNFITASDASKEAFKTATLLKTLTINALITGEVGVGKRSLASYILPDASVIDASDFDQLLTALESSREIVILNLEKSPNLKRVLDIVVSNDIRIIATASNLYTHNDIDDIFSIKLDIPPLKDRKEDIASLLVKFQNEASSMFGLSVELDFDNFTPNLSKNASSLKRQVMIHSLLSDIKDVELIDIMENYLLNKLGSNSDYREYLYLYEVPLIKAGLKRFKSQLQLSDKLGLNRNTLRKKIAENKKYL